MSLLEDEVLACKTEQGKRRKDKRTALNLISDKVKRGKRYHLDLHLALKLVSVKLSGFALALPTFNFAFCTELAIQSDKYGDLANLKVFLLFFLLFCTASHLCNNSCQDNKMLSQIMERVS